MKRSIYHVVPHGPDWVIKKEGSSTALQTFPTKEPAVEAGRALAKKVLPGQVKVHKKDGTIEFENTYGDDPRGTPG